jgi:hypothetical protein
LQETDGCRTQTAVQKEHLQMFAGQNDGELHGAVENVNLASHPASMFLFQWLLNKIACSFDQG